MMEITKIQAWVLLGILSLVQAALLYFGFDGDASALIIPLATYLFGIVTKTAVEKIKKT